MLTKILRYEENNGSWTLDDISKVGIDYETLKALIRKGYIEKVEEGVEAKYHTTEKAGGIVVVAEEIPDNLFDSIVGLDDIKELIYMALRAREPVHLLFVGNNASAKSLFLYCMERLPNSLYVDSAIATKTGIGNLLKQYRPRYLLMDEFDKMNADDYKVLLTLMSKGRYVETKARGEGRVDIEMRTWAFASANTVAGIPSAIMSRFLATIHFPEYDRVDAMQVIESILKYGDVDAELAGYIAGKVVNELHSRNPRVGIQLANMCSSKEDVDRAVELIKRRMYR